MSFLNSDMSFLKNNMSFLKHDMSLLFVALCARPGHVGADTRRIAAEPTELGHIPSHTLAHPVPEGNNSILKYAGARRSSTFDSSLASRNHPLRIPPVREGGLFPVVDSYKDFFIPSPMYLRSGLYIRNRIINSVPSTSGIK